MRRVVALGLVLLAAAPAAAEKREHGSLLDALRDSTASVDLRYRYEWVNEDTVGLDAHASTLRTALAYETGAYEGLAVFIEAENVSSVGAALYNNAGVAHLGNRRSARPVVADPELTQMNQAALRYTRRDTTVQVGRQEILLDDQRFVGNVGWRQNHQSFDALRVESSDVPRTILNYAFIRGVHGIRGGATPVSSHMLNGAFAVHAAARLVGYAYDIGDESDPRRSTTTWGVEVSGRPSGDEGGVLYQLEYAHQRAATVNPLRIEATYLHVMAGAEVGGIVVTAGRERLGGSPANGQFNTPLATLHPFNGWADRFLVTPAAGLEDTYVTVRGAVSDVQWSATYHDFRSDTGNFRYGDEVDFELRFLAPWRQTIAIKAALYDADSHASDVAKLMLWSSIRF